MIYELVIFTATPRKRAVLVELLEKLMPLRERYDMKVVGLWTTPIGRMQHVVQLLEYESLADLEKKRAAWNQDQDFLNLIASTEPCIQYEDISILAPTAHSPLR